jgi:hypothetical protein
MLTRFDILLIVLIVLSIIGFPAGVVSNRVPPYVVTIVVIVILIVLLLLGVVRY